MSSAHAAIEQVNRLFTGVVVAAVIAAVLGSLIREGRRRDLVLISWTLVVGVVANALLGAITVWVDLHPYAVQGHLLLSMGLIAAGAVLVRRAGEPDNARPPTDRRCREPPARRPTADRHDGGDRHRHGGDRRRAARGGRGRRSSRRRHRLGGEDSRDLGRRDDPIAVVLALRARAGGPAAAIRPPSLEVAVHRGAPGGDRLHPVLHRRSRDSCRRARGGATALQLVTVLILLDTSRTGRSSSDGHRSE